MPLKLFVIVAAFGGPDNEMQSLGLIVESMTLVACQT
jgi:hypothetical protein